MKKSGHVERKQAARQLGHKVDPHLEEQFSGGKVYACISSRPGQCGRCDGWGKLPFWPLFVAFFSWFLLKLLPLAFRYILEGKELEFYLRKLQKKKGKSAA